MIKTIIFDLDNCLSAADEVGIALLEPVFDAIRKANRGTLSDAALDAAFSECWRAPLDFVAKKHGFTQDMLVAGWEVCLSLEVRTPMRGYSDLGILPELPVQRFLVTSGFRRLQESKIRALGIAPHFKAIHVDAIDEADHKGKEGYFRDILSAFALKPDEVLVVGDNADSEIKVGNWLGIKTVQILRPGVTRSDTATHHISTLSELKAVIAAANK